MAKPISFEEAGVNLVSSMKDTPEGKEQDNVFRIAIMGDFSGRGSGSSSVSSASRALLVDRDNLDEVIAKLGVTARLSLDDSGDLLEIGFSGIDDFHPDYLYDRLGIFQSLRTLRGKLNDPENFAAAAAQVKKMLGLSSEGGKQTAKPSSKAVGSSESSGIDDADLLGAIIGGDAGEPLRPAPAKSSPSELDSFVKEVVSPHLVAAEDPMKQDLVDAVDSIISSLMQAILQHPEFQMLESTWRGVEFLCRRLETGEKIKLYLFDSTKDELTADLRSQEDLSRTQFYESFVGQPAETFGGEPWAVIIGMYYFDKSTADIETIGRAAKIAHHGKVPFITAATSTFVGCGSLADSPDPARWSISEDTAAAKLWQRVRSMPEAASTGLVLPRFLLRLPYGNETDAIDRFSFEEFPSPSEHDGYLWGNPAVACACLLGRSFSKQGWQMKNSMILDVANLPLHIYKQDGEKVIKPCAEIPMMDSTVEAIMDQGIMPLISFINQDRVRLGRFQSIAKPATALAARW